LSGVVIQQVIGFVDGILELSKPIFDRVVLGLLFLRIQKHSLDSGNCVPELLELIFETPEQPNLLKSKRAQTLNDTLSSVERELLRPFVVGDGESSDAVDSATGVDPLERRVKMCLLFTVAPLIASLFGIKLRVCLIF
jgi:hypothetical protein